MKILLTGGSGFIGKALLPELLAHGYEVITLGRDSDWAASVAGKTFDACIHLAWIATPGIYLESPENDLLAAATIRLADALFAEGLPHFLGLGTCIEYAPGQSGPCTESATPIDPQSTYGRAKERARAGIAEAAARHGSGYTWARLFYPYGLGEHDMRIPSIFLRTLSENKPLALKTPDSIKDFIEIRDVVSALIHLVENRSPQNEINLGTGNGVRIADLAHLAARLTNADPALVQSAEIPAADPYAFHIADAAKLASTGWLPAVTLDAGLSRLLANLTYR